MLYAIVNQRDYALQECKSGMKRSVNQALANLGMAHDAIIDSQVNQTPQLNKRWKVETLFAVGDKIYLSTQNLNLPKSRAGKLMPKYVRHYKVMQSHPEISRNTLNLWLELKAQRILDATSSINKDTYKASRKEKKQHDIAIVILVIFEIFILSAELMQQLSWYVVSLCTCKVLLGDW